MLSPVWCEKGVSESRAVKMQRSLSWAFDLPRIKAKGLYLGRPKPTALIFKDQSQGVKSLRMSQKLHQLFLIPCSISPENFFKIHCGVFKIFCWETILIVNEIFILLSNVVYFNEVLLQYLGIPEPEGDWSMTPGGVMMLLLVHAFLCSFLTPDLKSLHVASCSSCPGNCWLLKLLKSHLIFFLGSLFDLWTPFMW